MAIYTEFKHGLVLGTGDKFTVFGDRNPKEYNAIVWARKVIFKPINIYNIVVETPASQILWRNTNSEHVFSQYIERKLIHKFGKRGTKWDIDRPNKKILFEKEEDALWLIKFIKKQLRNKEYQW